MSELVSVSQVPISDQRIGATAKNSPTCLFFPPELGGSEVMGLLTQSEGAGMRYENTRLEL